MTIIWNAVSESPPSHVEPVESTGDAIAPQNDVAYEVRCRMMTAFVDWPELEDIKWHSPKATEEIKADTANCKTIFWNGPPGDEPDSPQYGQGT